MRSVSWIWIVAILGIFSCEQEEFITNRGYPFLESISVSDVDETGATVNFEILKYSGASISEYGVEFLDEANVKYGGSDPDFMKISEKGPPSGPLISIRIKYDLLNDISYLVRPYAKSGNRTVYGENLVFDSQGVHAPIITEVSPTEFYLNTPITVKGDYFNSKLENNAIEIVKGSEDYRISLDSVNRNQLKLRIGIVRPINTFESQSLTLKLTSGGKTVVFPVAITSIVPTVTQITPSIGYVGDKVQIDLNYPVSPTDYSIWLNFNDQNPVPLGHHKEISPQSAEFMIRDAPAGRYIPSFVNTWFPQEYKDRPIEILPSWENFQDGIAMPNLNEIDLTAVGDKLFIIGWDGIGGAKFQSLGLGANSLEDVPPPPTSQLARSYMVKAVEGDRYLYYGLGLRYLTNNTELFHDFFRLDIQTNQWERLADFPFEYSSVQNYFFLRGKLYVALWNYLNFRIYDPQTNKWEMSSVAVPQELRSSGSRVAIGDHVYFISSESNLTVNRYQIGGQVELFARSEEPIHYGGDLFFWDGHLVVVNNGSPSTRLNMTSKEFTLLQRVHESGFSRLYPWLTSQGLLMAFPVDKNSGFQKNEIYRLIQDF
jgi:hypothetical protein